MRVDVYWNFHKRVFSVRYRGRVIAHATRVFLYGCTFVVQKAGRERVRREGRKNVHAMVRGVLIPGYDYPHVPVLDVRYNPFRNDTFVTSEGTPVSHASFVECFAHDGKAHVRVLGSARVAA